VAFFGFGLVCLILIGAGIANRTPIPSAIIWALLGLGAAFVPGAPPFRLDPHLALFLVLPPLVYASATQLPWAEFRENLQPIALLSLGLVGASTVAVAFLAHREIGLSWAVAFALGAVISPTDPVAATAVAGRVGLPRRMVTILEGEGLVNDAVSLSIFRIALAVWAGAQFSVAGGFLRFIAILVGEPLYGFLLGKIVAFIRSRITDPQIEITVSLLTPFAAYLLPEMLGGSGILATVAVGMYIGEQSSTLVPSGTRLHATSVWRMIVFLLNGGLFITAGFELGNVIAAQHGAAPALVWGMWVAFTVALVRVIWCALSWSAVRAFRAYTGREDKGFTVGEASVIAWSGMRGPISLAAALSIPAAVGTVGDGNFETVLAITATVIVVTLIGQGAVLPALIGVAGLAKTAEAEAKLLRRQQDLGEREAAAAALECLSELERRGQVAPADAAHLRRVYKERLEERSLRADQSSAEASLSSARSALIEAERSRILALRRNGQINDQALERLLRTLDLREALVD
jgi:CPA1 family monovalent cation:H+ antiporter